MKLLKWEEAKKELETGVIFLEFSTSWCGDCKMMEPVIEKAETAILKKNPNVKFIQVDAEDANLFRDDNSDWKVLKVPSFFKIENGEKEHIGYEYLPLEKLIEKF